MLWGNSLRSLESMLSIKRSSQFAMNIHCSEQQQQQRGLNSFLPFRALGRVNGQVDSTFSTILGTAEGREPHLCSLWGRKSSSGEELG